MRHFGMDKSYEQIDFDEINVDELQVVSGGSGGYWGTPGPGGWPDGGGFPGGGFPGGGIPDPGYPGGYPSISNYGTYYG